MNNPVQIGDAELWLGDCLEIMPTLERVDACLTDPPYGIGQDKGFGGFGKPIARRQYSDEWDDIRPSKEVFDAIEERKTKCQKL